MLAWARQTRLWRTLSLQLHGAADPRVRPGVMLMLCHQVRPWCVSGSGSVLGGAASFRVESTGPLLYRVPAAPCIELTSSRSEGWVRISCVLGKDSTPKSSARWLSKATRPVFVAPRPQRRKPRILLLLAGHADSPRHHAFQDTESATLPRLCF